MEGRSSNLWLWLGVSSQTMSLLLIFISLGTSCWVWGMNGDTYITLGLWMGCMDSLCVKLSEAESALLHQMGDWVLWSQVTACIGFAVILLGLVAAIFCLICGSYRTSTYLLITATSAPITAMLYGFSVMMYLYNTHYAQIHWGFSTYAAVIGIASALTSAFCFMRQHDRAINRSGYTRLN